MLPKHANGKFSHGNVFWETSMRFGKKFFRGRSQFAHAPRYAAVEADVAPALAASALAAPAWQSRPLRLAFRADQVDPGQTPGRRADADRLQPASSEETPRRTIRAAGFALIIKAMARCGACAELAFANFPVGILSWMLAQFFVGCAAYAEAMYPSAAYVREPENEEADARDPSRSGPPERRDSGRSPSLAPDLRELSRFTIDDGGRRSPFPLAGRTQSIAARSVGTAKIVRLNVTRRAPSGRLVSITLLVAAWLSGRRPRNGGQVTVELRNHDRRTLRGTRLSRYRSE